MPATPATAIVREPGENLAAGITTADLGLPDPDRALAQHRAYCDALRAAGLGVVVLPADPRHPDGCFVEDTAVILDEVAVITRPGDPSRRGEVEAVAEVLAGYRPLARLRSPGRLDGGDVLRCGDHLHIGRSARTDAEGAGQLAEIAAARGYTTSEVPVDGELHLKTGVTGLGDGRLVATAGAATRFPSSEVVVVSEEETYAANCLRLHDRVLIPDGCPRVRVRLVELGYQVVALEMSEFRKMDGGLTCLSLLC
ncbi:MAG TPA: hypothetical protein VK858_21890 [Longimicrobiales bacterium]|nr:hypothetical protein [Longimicrobiales bacterium]